VESDLAASKARIMQLEASLKSREREVTHLTRTIEALKTDLHEADARQVNTNGAECRHHWHDELSYDLTSRFKFSTWQRVVFGRGGIQ
jgi:hypothetical protein